jgi:hypothetical protein
VDKIFMGPAWDFDISCGNISWDDCDKVGGFWVKNASWYEKLFEDKVFCELVKERWISKRSEIEKSIIFLKKSAVELKPAIMFNDAVWKNIGHRQWPHAPGWKNRKTMESEIDYMINFLEKRALWFDSALENL